MDKLKLNLKNLCKEQSLKLVKIERDGMEHNGFNEKTERAITATKEK